MVIPVPDYIGLAQQCYDRGDYRGALSHCNQALYLNSKHDRAYLYRGIVFHQMKYYQGAIADYTEALLLNPNIVSAYYYRGLARSEMGDYQGAIADYDRGIAIDPEDLAYKYWVNDVSLRQDTSNNEIEDVRIYPNLALAYYNRGIARYNLRDKEGAIEDYTQAIAINPYLAEAYINRGNTRALLGDRQGAIDDYELSIKINPNLAETYGSWGIALAEMGNKQEAIEYLEKAADFFEQQGNLESYERVINKIFELKHDLSSERSFSANFSDIDLEKFDRTEKSQLDNSEDIVAESVLQTSEFTLKDSEENQLETKKLDDLAEFPLQVPPPDRITNLDNFENFAEPDSEQFTEFQEIDFENFDELAIEPVLPTLEIDLKDNQENQLETENLDNLAEFPLQVHPPDRITNLDKFENFAEPDSEQFTEFQEIDFENFDELAIEPVSSTPEFDLKDSQENQLETKNLDDFAEFTLEEVFTDRITNLDNNLDNFTDFVEPDSEQFTEFKGVEFENFDELAIESDIPTSEFASKESQENQLETENLDNLAEFPLQVPPPERVTKSSKLLDNFDDLSEADSEQFAEFNETQCNNFEESFVVQDSEIQFDGSDLEIDFLDDFSPVNEAKIDKSDDNYSEDSADGLERDDFDDIFLAYFPQEESEIDNFSQVDLEDNPVDPEENLKNLDRIFNNDLSEDKET